MLKLTWLVACCCASTFAYAQVSKDTITKEITFERTSADNLLVVEGAVGGIEVEGYSGETVLIEAVRIIRADAREDLQKGKGEISFEAFRQGRNELFLDVFKVDPKPNTVYVYLLSPGSLGHEQTGTFLYSDSSESKYDYTLNYRIKVPYRTNLSLRTIAGGNIIVRNTAGKITACLMSGSIFMNEVSGPTEAKTLKGDISVSYQQNPLQTCSYTTHDGNISASYQAGLDADVEYQAGGQLINGFAVNKLLSSPVADNGIGKSKISYKTGNHSFRIGSGGIRLHYWAANGDVLIKKATR